VYELCLFKNAMYNFTSLVLVLVCKPRGDIGLYSYLTPRPGKENERSRSVDPVKRATSRLGHLQKFSLNFSSSLFIIRVNLLHS